MSNHAKIGPASDEVLRQVVDRVREINDAVREHTGFYVNGKLKVLVPIEVDVLSLLEEHRNVLPES